MLKGVTSMEEVYQMLIIELQKPQIRKLRPEKEDELTANSRDIIVFFIILRKKITYLLQSIPEFIRFFRLNLITIPAIKLVNFVQ